MAEEVGQPLETCPVLRAWASSEQVKRMLLKGKVLQLNYPKLGRPMLADNTDVLAPILNALGFLTA